MAPNKTLAAQLANEFRELLPNNAVEYFVSYYDYYQPEAYVPQTRHLHREGLLDQRGGRAAAPLRDQLPADPARRDRGRLGVLHLRPRHAAGVRRPDGPARGRRGASTATSCCAASSTSSTPATTWPSPAARSGSAATPSRSSRSTRSSPSASRCSATRSSGSRRCTRSPARSSPRTRSSTSSRPPTTSPARSAWSGPSTASRSSSPTRLAELEQQGKLLEAQRLRMRTTYDIEMMRQVGSCSGIENYSRHIDGRAPGSAPQLPARLLPRGLPARHRRVARHRAADRRACTRATCPASARWSTTASGCRAPMDNRPLKWEEFLERIGQTVYLSATPGSYELGRGQGHVGRADHPARPAWSTRRSSSSRPRARSTTWSTRSGCGPSATSASWSPRSPRRWPRTSPTTCSSWASGCATCTPRSTRCAGSSCCASCGWASYDVLVGINLLREGLDLPEVSLVAILDADKEGFLRSGTSLIQTIGRAARNVSGQVHMYADTVTDSMEQGDRRDQPAARQAGRLQRGARHRPAAAAQEDRRHHRAARPRGRRHRGAARRSAAGSSRAARRRCPGCRPRTATISSNARASATCPPRTSPTSSSSSPTRCTPRPRELQFELAARLRDEIGELKKELRGMRAAGTA